MAGLIGKIRVLYGSFKDKNVVTLAASVSFFGFLSLFPFLVLLASVASFLMQKKEAVIRIEELLSSFPPAVADTVLQTLRGAVASGKMVSVVSFVLLVFSSLAAFGQLRLALNRVMGMPRKLEGRKAGLKTFGFYAATAFVALLLMLGGGVFFVLAAKLARVSSISRFWTIEAGIIVVQVLIFAVSYRYLAAKLLPWKNVLIGGAVTALSWEILKYLFGLYANSIGSLSVSYGFISSVFFLMLWLFYSVLIYFWGAHISVELG
jgi:membrane protein